MVSQVSLANRNRLCGYCFLKNRVLHSVCSQNGQISRCRIVPRSIKAIGIFEMGIFQPQLMRFVIHKLCKSLHRSTAIDCQCNGCIITGMKHQAVKKFLDCQHFPFLQIHGRTFNSNGFFWDSHSIQDIALLTNNKCSHDFRSTGNQAPRVCVLLIKDTSSNCVQQNGFLSRNCKSLKRKNQDGGQQCSRRPGDNSFHCSSPGSSIPGIRKIIH